MSLKTKTCKYGTFTFNDNDAGIGSSLDQTGAYGDEVVCKLLSLLSHDAVVIEVGANIGAITVPLAQHVKRLISFETQPAICDLLWRNVMDNRVSVDVREFVVGSAPARVSLPNRNTDAPFAELGAVSVTETEASVPAVTLDDHCRNFDRLDLIKIDAEGCEAEVIAGARETIKRLEPLLYVENDSAEQATGLITQIMALGYRLYWHFPSVHNPDPTVEQFLVSSNVVCVPRDCVIDLTDLTPITDPYQDREVSGARAAKPARKGREPAAVLVAQ